jgi:spermidine synthase
MPERVATREARLVLAAALSCFFLSGVAALLYEVVWTRYLGVTFGHTVHAITTVLAVYMGGLALGSALAGAVADRTRHPLRLYGLLEAAIGLYCLATPILFGAADAVYLWAHRLLRPGPAGAAGLHLVISAALLLPPTTLMGATLPILARGIVSRQRLAAADIGRLYAVNTCGAVAGTVVTGFLLLPAIGLRTTIWLGVALNVLVAAIAFGAGRRSLGPASERERPEAPASDAQAPGSAPATSRSLVLAVLAAFGLSGAASMAYELAWTRALSLVLGSSTYAFSAMLATFLVGLALGSALASRVLSRRPLGAAAFGAVEVSIALATVALLPAFGRLPEAVLAVLAWTGVSHATMLATQVALGFGLMIVPTCLVGATFPLVVAAVGRGLARLGRDVGVAYAANTVGTIIGSIGAGFVLIRSVGIQNTVIIAATANLIAGAGVIALAAGGANRRRLVAVGVAAAAFAALVVVVPRWDPNLMSTGVGVYAQLLVGKGADGARELSRGRELVFYDEGISTTVGVFRDPTGTVLTVNGKGDASNDVDMATQLLLGHIGPLLQPGTNRALVIGFASGVTVGALLQHPVQAVDVAELEPAMRQASSFFRVENRDALADPRVRMIEGDGRSILATAAEPYDLVISEPSNPWIAGVASLFTSDFYRAVRARLAPGGVVVQWLQNYSIFDSDLRMVVRTFQETFPHVSIWAASPNDWLLVATPEPVRLDLASVRRQAAASPGLRDDLERFHWVDEELAARFVLDEDEARRYAAGARVNSDDRPLLEFSAPLALYGSSPEENEVALRSVRTREVPPVVGLDAARLGGVEGDLRSARANWLAGQMLEARWRVSRVGAHTDLAPSQRRDLARMLFVLGELDAAAIQLELAARALPQDPEVARYRRGLEALAAAGLRDRIAPSAGSALRATLADALLDLARRSGDRDLYALALEQLEAELVVRPGSFEMTNNYAGALYELRQLDASARALRRAIALNPRSSSTHLNLGIVLEELGRANEAAQHYERAAALDPSATAARRRLAAIQSRSASAPRK